ncbi:hypothetical protein KXJ69_11575 [Aureisphaera sp. CAU 1614]|uniref:Uncharacterized protein n=1 Tax=Halomarinibacterium sedimenti TaxID=2857106 RepID=A0A9X1FQQ2_9FLAO|nr:hypothetical protein [Halomarinibacterium sedimenti]MBW2938752.1 hypothetical protein [Halomarinibacterium sedimenti]
MNKLIIAFVFSLAFVFSGYSQKEKLSNYSFIVVPKKFDFQFSDDQYQLNSLLKFLFNKHGFHAYFDDELPDVRRCDGLRAEVTGDPNFVWTRVTIYIKDCEGNVIYTSEEGKSKLKEYSKTYNQAMRRAFESIEALFVQQKEVRVLKDFEDSSERKEEKKVEAEVVSQKDNPLHLPVSKYANYTNAGKSFLLRKTNEGFSLYEETAEASDGLKYTGKVFVVEGVVFFEDEKEQRYIANFDTSGNLTVEKEGGKVTYSKSN